MVIDMTELTEEERRKEFLRIINRIEDLEEELYGTKRGAGYHVSSCG